MRKRKRRKKMKNINGLNSMSLIVITMIVMLNIAGISYAYWGHGLDINTSIDTGKIDPYFIDNIENTCGISVKVDDYKIEVGGEIKSESGKEYILHYSIGNRGTMPVKLKRIRPIRDSDRVTLNKPISDLKPGEYWDECDENPKLEIRVNKNDGKDIHFKYELIFDQWNID